MANIEELLWPDGDTNWGDEFRTLVRALNTELEATTTRSKNPAAHIANGAIALEKLSEAARAAIAKADGALTQDQVDDRARAMIAEWVGVAPAELDTLVELATRLTSSTTELTTQIQTALQDASIANVGVIEVRDDVTLLEEQVASMGTGGGASLDPNLGSMTPTYGVMPNKPEDTSKAHVWLDIAPGSETTGINVYDETAGGWRNLTTHVLSAPAPVPPTPSAVLAEVVIVNGSQRVRVAPTIEWPTMPSGYVGTWEVWYTGAPSYVTVRQQSDVDRVSSTSISPDSTRQYVVRTVVTKTSTGDRYESPAVNANLVTGRTPPTALFSVVPFDLSVNVDASSSSAGNGGTITSVLVEFGDGATATTLTSTHTYATAGTKTITLTVTDNLGLTSTATKEIALSVVTATLDDDFNRTSTTTAGVAPTGQTWNRGSTSDTWATDGANLYVVGYTNNARIHADIGTNNQRVSWVLTTAQEARLMYRYEHNNTYNFLNMLSDGSIQIGRRQSAAERQVGPTIPAGTWTPGAVVSVTATNESTGGVRHVVRVNDTEVLDVVDTTGYGGSWPDGLSVGFQHRGAGLEQKLARITAWAVSGSNRPPIPSFTATASGATVTVDASGSLDPDNDGLTYAWDFGDGSTGTGITATRTYATSGTKTITLTTTDAKGASATTSRTVDVTVPSGETSTKFVPFTAVFRGESLGAGQVISSGEVTVGSLAARGAVTLATNVAGQTGYDSGRRNYIVRTPSTSAEAAVTAGNYIDVNITFPGAVKLTRVAVRVARENWERPAGVHVRHSADAYAVDLVGKSASGAGSGNMETLAIDLPNVDVTGTYSLRLYPFHSSGTGRYVILDDIEVEAVYAPTNTANIPTAVLGADRRVTIPVPSQFSGLTYDRIELSLPSHGDDTRTYAKGPMVTSPHEFRVTRPTRYRMRALDDVTTTTTDPTTGVTTTSTTTNVVSDYVYASSLLTIPTPKLTPQPSGGRLRWAPPFDPGQADHTVQLVGGQTYTIRSAGRYRMLMPTGPGSVQINVPASLESGDIDVVIIGGEVTAKNNQIKIQTWGWHHDRRERFHLEGIRTHTPNIGYTTLDGTLPAPGFRIPEAADNIIPEFRSPNSSLTIQNFYGDQIGGSKNDYTYPDTSIGKKGGYHADIIQTWAGPSQLRVDRLFGQTHYQGMFLIAMQHAPEWERDAHLFRDWEFYNIGIKHFSSSQHAQWTDGQGNFREKNQHGIDIWNSAEFFGGPVVIGNEWWTCHDEQLGPVSKGVENYLTLGGRHEHWIYDQIMRKHPDNIIPAHVMPTGNPGNSYVSPGYA